MMATVVLSVSEDAVRFGVGSGCFHGFEFRAVRLGRRTKPGVITRICVDVCQDGELIESLLIDAMASRTKEG